ncbi:hypothetical protein NKH77_47705 [Streptomyces sp. M19]
MAARRDSRTRAGGAVRARHVTRKAAGWLLMIVVATNATYVLSSWFLDPRANFRGCGPSAARSRSTGPWPRTAARPRTE